MAENNEAQAQQSTSNVLYGMPEFNGHLLDWMKFWNAFERDIHNDPTMPNWLKFSKLKALLKGEEFDFIKKLHNSDANYKLAVAKLKSEYGQMDKIASLRMKSIMDMKPIHENCDLHLQEFYEELWSHISELKSLTSGVQIDYASLATSLLNKLPSYLKQRIIDKYPNGDGITLSVIMKSLNISIYTNAIWAMDRVNEDCSNLEEFLRDLNSHLGALDSLGEEYDNKTSLVTALISKLPWNLKQLVYEKHRHHYITINLIRGALNKIFHAKAILNMTPVNDNHDNLVGFFEEMSGHLVRLDSVNVTSLMVASLVSKLPLDLKTEIFDYQQTHDVDLLIALQVVLKNTTQLT